MEKEIGSVPDRDGFDVHVDGEEILITQYNGDNDCDVVSIHACDAVALIDLLDAAVDSIMGMDDVSGEVTLQTVIDHGKKNGYIVLSKEYVNSLGKLDITWTECGHKDLKRWAALQQGQGCRPCNYPSGEDEDVPMDVCKDPDCGYPNCDKK